MGGWSTVTIKGSFEVQAFSTEKTCSECGQTIEADEDELPSHYQELIKGESDSKTLVFVFDGYNGLEEDVSRVKEILNSDRYKIKGLDYVSIVQANNTSDDGVGYVFDSEMNQIDKIEGYQGANARDVAGKVKERYGFSPGTSWEGN